MRNASPIAIRIAGIYAAFGAAWILGSDNVLAWFVDDPALMTAVQSWKGLAYVGLSAVLIYVVAGGLLRRLAGSEQRYRALFSESPEALLIYDPLQFRVVDSNDAACRMLDWDREAMVGQDLTGFMTQPCRAEFLKSIDGAGARPAYVSGFWRLIDRSGRNIDVSVHDRAVSAGGRDLRQVLLIDVTARLRAEGELLKALDELAAVNIRMQELGHAVSHDLQEPLRQISGFVQLLQRRYENLVDDEARQYIDFAVEGTARLKTLIGDLERYTSRPHVGMGLTDAAAALAEAADDLRDSMSQAQAELRVGDLPMVLADHYRMAVVFHCLLENALKFRRHDRPCVITVSAVRDGAFHRITVADNGIGIEPQYRAEVFALFKRLHTRSQIPGNGLGLALVKKMTESFGGSVWVDQSESGGAAVVFTVTAIDDETPADSDS